MATYLQTFLPLNNYWNLTLKLFSEPPYTILIMLAASTPSESFLRPNKLVTASVPVNNLVTFQYSLNISKQYMYITTSAE